MRNLTAVSDSEAQPLSMNRRLLQVLSVSTLDLSQASMLAPVPYYRLKAYFGGELCLTEPELSALACLLRDVLRQNNRRLEKLLSLRRPRKIRKARSAEATAQSLEKARSALAAKRALAGQ